MLFSLKLYSIQSKLGYNWSNEPTPSPSPAHITLMFPLVWHIQWCEFFYLKLVCFKLQVVVLKYLEMISKVEQGHKGVQQIWKALKGACSSISKFLEYFFFKYTYLQKWLLNSNQKTVAHNTKSTFYNVCTFICEFVSRAWTIWEMEVWVLNHPMLLMLINAYSRQGVCAWIDKIVMS